MDPDNDADAEPQHEGFEQASTYKNDADVPIPSPPTISDISIYLLKCFIYPRTLVVRAQTVWDSTRELQCCTPFEKLRLSEP